VWRGDSHYGREEVMEWAENNGVDYDFCIAGNSVLASFVTEAADHLLGRPSFAPRGWRAS
jgi:hypothetical protein